MVYSQLNYSLGTMITSFDLTIFAYMALKPANNNLNIYIYIVNAKFKIKFKFKF
jgi:hypothetical protein